MISRRGFLTALGGFGLLAFLRPALSDDSPATEVNIPYSSLSGQRAGQTFTTTTFTGNSNTIYYIRPKSIRFGRGGIVATGRSRWP